MWKFKGFSDESIKLPAASNNILGPELNHIKTKLCVRFDGSCLKEKEVAFTYKPVINIYIVFEINLSIYTQGANFTLGSSLFGDVKLNENANFDQYECSGYGSI